MLNENVNMSAVPKKKLCWNCEGSVAKNIDNCPYCGVYLHGTEEPSENNLWNPSYTPSINQESPTNISSPFYSPETVELTDEDEHTKKVEGNSLETQQLVISTQLKRDFFPIFFLMSGSIFFLFGLVLLLFSSHGTFTLQWNGDNWIYFLSCSLPLLVLGWKFLQDTDKSSD